MLAVARCVPSMEASGVADTRDGDPDADRSPLATVAEGESDCEGEPETVNMRLCVSAGVCELVSDSKGDSVTTAVEVGESVATSERDAVAVGVPDANDESDAEPEVEGVRSGDAVDDAELEIVGERVAIEGLAERVIGRMLAVARCVPPTELRGDSVATDDGKLVTVESPVATVAEADNDT
jgi:hypothetical protein